MSEKVSSTERKNKSEAEVAEQISRIADKLADRAIDLVGARPSYDQIQEAEAGIKAGHNGWRISHKGQEGGLEYDITSIAKRDNDDNPSWKNGGNRGGEHVNLSTTDEAGVEYSMSASPNGGEMVYSPRDSRDFMVSKDGVDESGIVIADVSAYKDTLRGRTARYGEGVSDDDQYNILDRGQTIRVAAKAAGKIRSEMSKQRAEHKQKSIERSEQVLKELDI